MSKVVTMNGEAVRTVEQVIHELNELVAVGEVRSLLIVVEHPNKGRHVDWSNQPMSDLIYSTAIAEYNMLEQLSIAREDE